MTNAEFREYRKRPDVLEKQREASRRWKEQNPDWRERKTDRRNNVYAGDRRVKYKNIKRINLFKAKSVELGVHEITIRQRLKKYPRSIALSVLKTTAYGIKRAISEVGGEVKTDNENFNCCRDAQWRHNNPEKVRITNKRYRERKTLGESLPRACNKFVIVSGCSE